MEGMIFDIQRFSLQDGPGIRTTVFFKGCSLDCFWCHNPESKSSFQQLQFFRHLCTGCRACISACSQKALEMGTDHRAILRRDRCLVCGDCAKVCPAEALMMCGSYKTVDDVMQVLLRDKPFYEQSGGGITISGGEPLMQADFAAELLKRCRDEGLHTAVDTAGHVPWESFEKVLPYTHLFLYDLKGLDSDKHKQATGVDQAVILRNLERLSNTGASIIIRIPVIPGYNDQIEDMTRMAQYLHELQGIECVELSPYHRLADGKLESLGQKSDMPEAVDLSPEAAQTLLKPFEDRSICVRYLNS